MNALANLFSIKFTYIIACIFFSCAGIAQQPITSISTENITQSQVTHTGVKGAGLRSPLSALISSWDSLFSYTVNFNTPATANILRLNQFSVSGFTSSVMTMPVESHVKLRRAANTDIGNARNYYNFWAQYSSTPLLGALGGTFNFTAPEVIDPEDAFMLNNLTSGYDNIFQNTIANPHLGNIERVDFIIPSGLQCINDADRQQSGVAVIDRGTGDPFKIAAITGLNASNDPVSFGNLVSVTASNFGPNLLPAAINYGILINDVNFKSESRPSTRATQNLRGVYISLADLGLVIGQRFYGYALFGPDVVTAHPDWTTYPTNTNGGSQLDPVNIIGLYKTAFSVLPVRMSFTAVNTGGNARLDFTLFNEFNGDHLVIERSPDGISFHDLYRLYVHNPGTYTFTDHTPLSGNNYYRVKMVDKNGGTSASETRLLKFEDAPAVSCFPNPATTHLNIRLPDTWSREVIVAEIFNNLGQLVKRTRLDQYALYQSISLRTLRSGTYLLRLVKNGSVAAWQQQFTVI